MAKSKTGKFGLKMLAADAKERLKNGFYNKTDIDYKFNSGDYFMMVKRSFSSKQNADKEEQFYKKVKEILSEGAVTNPILRLVDSGALESLGYSARQRYLLEISEKFNKIKNEIERMPVEV